jgi:hypothetical protein
VKIFENPDFEQAIIRAAEHFSPRGLRDAIIEKDYFVIESLRIIEQKASSKVIYKGGTSLSKGWSLIQGFRMTSTSFLTQRPSRRPRGKKAIDRELKKLRQVIPKFLGCVRHPPDNSPPRRRTGMPIRPRTNPICVCRSHGSPAGAAVGPRARP